MSRARRVRQTAQPPRASGLEALAEQAQRAGWEAEWQLWAAESQWGLRLRVSGVWVEAFVESSGALSCRAQYLGHWSWLARTPAEALRQAYGALGVALDQAEESGLGRLETPAQDSDA